MNCKFILYFVFTLLFFETARGQKSANVWVIGDTTGIDFNSIVPSQIYTSVGGGYTVSACQRDSGSLIFYADQRNIFGNNGIVIDSFPNDNASSIIVPMPGNDSLFYVFMTYTYPAFGIKYSIYNRNNNAGLGGIQPGLNGIDLDVSSYIYHNIAAVHHANGCDVWVVVHNDSGDVFKSYLVSSSGIASPVISHAGQYFTGSGPNIGKMKFSPDGGKLAMTINITGVGGIPTNMISGLELFNFNNQTGVISNTLINLITGPMNRLYVNQFHGVSFSCDNSKLYYSQATGEIFQLNLLAGTDNDIINSKTVINLNNIHFQNLSVLQLGPDHKIYTVGVQNGAIAVINEPEKVGVASNFQDSVFLRSPNGLSMPQFIESYFYCPPITNFSADTMGCVGDSMNFSVDSVFNSTNYEWTFGDSQSANGTETNHVFGASGNYDMNLILHYNCNALIAAKRRIIIVDPPGISLVNDTLFCGNDSIRIIAGNDSSLSYTWSTGDTLPYLTTNTPGNYRVTVSNGTCSLSDSVMVHQKPYPLSSLLTDTMMCGNDSLILTAGNPGVYSYNWSTGDSTSAISVSAPGTYSVVINDSICQTIDSIIVRQLAYPVSSLPVDTFYCGSDSVLLSAGLGNNLSYVWSTGDTTASIFIYATGRYSVMITDSFCMTVDSVQVNQFSYPALILPDDTLQCGNAPVTLIAGQTGYIYLWSTGDTVNQITIVNPGKYFVSASDLSCISTDSVLVNHVPLPVIVLPTDTSYCGSGSLYLRATNPNNNYSYNWSTGDTSAIIAITLPGIYSVRVSDSTCSVDASILVTQKPALQIDKIPNVFTPDGDGKNDEFKLGDNIQTNSLIIWDRWGKKVFESHVSDATWNGNFNGELLLEGTYYYIAEVLDCTGNFLKLNGFVYLKR